MANPQKEYIEDGYIKLSRKIFNSKTFSSLNAVQKLIAIYLVLMANHKDGEWWDDYQKKFITIKRGSFITSIEHIRKKIKDKLVTTKKIRTCVKLLKKMQFLATERASRYSLITIIKYDLYQSNESYRARQKARQGQDKGKIRATNNNGNNGKNGKKEDTLSSRCALIIDYLNEKTGRNEKGQRKFDPKNAVEFLRARFNEGRTVKDCIDVIDIKLKDWLNDEKMFQFLRPSTLFKKTNFENYISQKKPDKYSKYYKKE